MMRDSQLGTASLSYMMTQPSSGIPSSVNRQTTDMETNGEHMPRRSAMMRDSQLGTVSSSHMMTQSSSGIPSSVKPQTASTNMETNGEHMHRRHDMLRDSQSGTVSSTPAERTGDLYDCITQEQRQRMGGKPPPVDDIVWQRLSPAIKAWLMAMGRQNEGFVAGEQRDAEYLMCQRSTSERSTSERCTHPCLTMSQAGDLYHHERTYEDGLFNLPGLSKLRPDTKGPPKTQIGGNGWYFHVADLANLIQRVTVYRGIWSKPEEETWPRLLGIDEPADGAHVEFAHRTAVAGPVYAVGTAYGDIPFPANPAPSTPIYAADVLPKLVMVCVSPVNFSNIHDVSRFVVQRGRPLNESEASAAIKSLQWKQPQGGNDHTYQLLQDTDALERTLEATWSVALCSMHAHSLVVKPTIGDTIHGPTLVQPVLYAIGCDAEA